MIRLEQEKKLLQTKKKYCSISVSRKLLAYYPHPKLIDHQIQLGTVLYIHRTQLSN